MVTYKTVILASSGLLNTRVTYQKKSRGIPGIMPCPSTAELLLMTNYIRPFWFVGESFPFVDGLWMKDDCIYFFHTPRESIHSSKH